ncbi:hypothetical protein [Arvimicrobium flavum]|uniref:hypothetical protein n=1 Tax=Arvimicrobium flavum TaxID=3393320 RepID=UPI00237C0725|nr:hypothetical protein [Mesorhizobium shangrilense]
MSNTILDMLFGWEGAPTAWLTFVAAIAGTLIALRTSGRSTYGSTVTLERSRWINSLRENIAGMTSAVSSARAQADIGQYAGAEALERIHRLAGTLMLQLNPNGAIEQNLLKLIQPYIISAANPQGAQQFTDYQNAIFIHSQFLLKEEWEKVKTEASSSLWNWTVGGRRRRRRKREYERYCRTKEAMLHETTGSPSHPPMPVAGTEFIPRG